MATTQLTLSLASKPGGLAEVASTLAQAGGHITGICAPESPGGRRKMRLLVDDPARAAAALTAAKLRVGHDEAHHGPRGPYETQREPLGAQ